MKKLSVLVAGVLMVGGMGLVGCENNDSTSADERSSGGRSPAVSQASEGTPANEAARDAQQAGNRVTGDVQAGPDTVGSSSPAGSSGVGSGATGIGTGATGAEGQGVSNPAATGHASGTNNLRNPLATGASSQPTTRVGTPR